MLTVLVLSVYGFLWWGPGHSTLGNDYSVFQPRQQLVFMQAFRDGHFPLWLRGEFAGVPFAQYLFAGQYWPATWAMLAWEGVFEGSQLEVLTCLRLITLGMAGFFTYLTLRRLGTSALPAILAGAVFVFNFRTLDAFRYGMALDVVVWMPAVVYLIECAIARPRLHLALFYGIAHYLLLVPGHMQEAIYCIYFATLYVLFRALMLVKAEGKSRPWRWLGVRAACLGGGQMLAFGLCAVMLIPLFEDVLPSFIRRNAAGTDFSSQYHMSWIDLGSNVFFPWLANVSSGFYSAQTVWLVIALAGGALIFKGSRIDLRDRRLLVFLLCIFFSCILYSLGPLTPVAGVVNAVVPFCGKFRAPGRTMTVGMFAVAIAVGIAIDRFLRGGGSDRAIWRGLIGGYVIFLLGGLGLALSVFCDWIGLYERDTYIPVVGNTSRYAPTRIQADPVHMVPEMAAIMIATALTGLALVFLWRRGRIGRTGLVALLATVSLVETGVYLRRGTWIDEGPVVTARSSGFKDIDVYHSRMDHGLNLYPNAVPTPPMPADTNTAFHVTPGPLHQLLVYGGEGAWQIFHQSVPASEMPRAYVTPAVHLARGDDLRAIAESDPRATSVIDITDPANLEARDDLALEALSLREIPSSATLIRSRFRELNADLEVVEYTFNRAGFRVNTSIGGLFNYSDGYAKGWRASIDGEEVPVYRTNHTFKAVVLPPGEHTVNFVYDPATFRVGLQVSLVSVCGLLCCLAVCCSRVTWRRVVFGVVTAMLVVLPARLAYTRIYERINRGGMMNYSSGNSTQAAHFDGLDRPTSKDLASKS